MASADSISLERGVIASLAMALFALFGAVALASLRVTPIPAFCGALALAAFATPRLARGLPRDWDGIRRGNGLICGLWIILALAALARTAGVAVFMADAAHPEASAMWFDDFYIQHNCFSAWWKAAQLTREGIANVYESDPYAGYEGRFKLDDFLYLPQFLILPRAGIATGADFLQLRAAWFAIEGTLLAGAMLALAVRVGGAPGRRIALAMPAVWLATPTVLTLQIGNFQIAAIAMSLLAMLAFEKRRDAMGGALLGFALFKIFPGLLGVYLVVTRQWRAVFWTAAFCAVYSAIAYAVMGAAPFDAFIHYELPRIANGDAWAWLESENVRAAVAINDSVPGLVLKLKELGAPGMTRELERVLSGVWTLVAVAFAVVAGLRARRMNALEKAVAWTALLAVAAFRSPFVPDTYGLFPMLWLWSLLWGADAPSPRRVVAFAALWIAFACSLPFSGMPLPEQTGRILLSSLSQLVAMALCLRALSLGPRQAGVARVEAEPPPRSALAAAQA